MRLPSRLRGKAAGAFSLEGRQGFQAGLQVRLAVIRPQCIRAQDERPGPLLLMALQAPGSQHADTFFPVQSGRSGQIEHKVARARPAQFSSKQGIMALAGFPGNPVQRIPLTPVAQAEKFIAVGLALVLQAVSIGWTFR